jgi:hypothetical protein
MDLHKISEEIKQLLEERRIQSGLTFIEEDHIYYMRDKHGEIRTDFPSVSKLIKKFHTEFDAEAKALQMSKGDVEAQQKLLREWKAAGDYSTNMGSRVHYELELDVISRYNNYKDVRRPIFQIDEAQTVKSDNMIKAGKTFLDLMHERGAVLLDTEIVLGDNELGYTGQPDKVWLMLNKEKTGFGLVITDWKTNQPKNFVSQWYTKKLYNPFAQYDDTALGHYYLQLPLYARLLLKMLEGTKYGDIKLFGCVVVLLKDDGTYEEFKVPQDVNLKVLNLDIKKYTGAW